ncbi:hypothetical protein I7I51_03740 [Histoplasma capsulatum]|uniref:Uncharacterized protein n=1 Tax=Ajellomyces capsulatus TaxID=5037 RepID=A0A8A1MA04_AJECA|nr:hypothetical protein I7I51_03740 [Histoplasma capsulatum]
MRQDTLFGQLGRRESGKRGRSGGSFNSIYPSQPCELEFWAGKKNCLSSDYAEIEENWPPIPLHSSVAQLSHFDELLLLIISQGTRVPSNPQAVEQLNVSGELVPGLFRARP